MDKIVLPQVICIDDHPAEYWARSFINTVQQYNDAVDAVDACRKPSFENSYVKIKIANREIQLDLPYVGDYTDGYAALAACIISALNAINMEKTLDYITYNWEPTDD